MANLLVTGPFGNIGSHIVPELLREGHAVRTFDLDTPATRKVARAVDELSPRLREVFVLREMEELSTEETATALGVSEAVVKTRLHRARLWLRDRLSAYFNEFAS